jgi:hypothetical protein
MKYHSIRDTGSRAVWVVEADDHGGELSSAIFVGDNARQRAEEYAAWKNGGVDTEALSRVPEQPKVA